MTRCSSASVAALWVVGVLAAAAGGCRERAVPAPTPALSEARTPEPSEPSEPSPPVPPPGLAEVDAIMAHVVALSAPALAGRQAGTTSEREAAEYIAAALSSAGVEPGAEDGSMFQPFAYVHTPDPLFPRPKDGVILAPDSTPDSDLRMSQNVIGRIAGTDPALRDRAIVVAAHYDHLGVDATGAVYPGADDNASGVAGLLAVAAALSEPADRPRRTVLVIAFGAEETGLHGSSHYVAHPAVPLARTDLMINLDMIGRDVLLDAEAYALARIVLGNDPAVGVLTARSNPDVLAAARAACDAAGIPMFAASDYPAIIEREIRAQAEHRGDHRPFADRGVRWLWFSTSMNDDYHRPTDTVDKVSGAVIRKIAHAVVATVHELER